MLEKARISRIEIDALTVCELQWSLISATFSSRRPQESLMLPDNVQRQPPPGKHGFPGIGYFSRALFPRIAGASTEANRENTPVIGGAGQYQHQ